MTTVDLDAAFAMLERLASGDQSPDANALEQSQAIVMQLAMDRRLDEKARDAVITVGGWLALLYTDRTDITPPQATTLRDIIRSELAIARARVTRTIA